MTGGKESRTQYVWKTNFIKNQTFFLLLQTTTANAAYLYLFGFKHSWYFYPQILRLANRAGENQQYKARPQRELRPLSTNHIRNPTSTQYARPIRQRKRGGTNYPDGRLSNTAHGGFSLNSRCSHVQNRDIFYTGTLLSFRSYPSSRWCSSFSQSLQCPWSSTSSFSGISAVSFSSAIFNQEVGGHRVPSIALKQSRCDWSIVLQFLFADAFTDRDLVGYFQMNQSYTLKTENLRKISCVKAIRSVAFKNKKHGVLLLSVIYTLWERSALVAATAFNHVEAIYEAAIFGVSLQRSVICPSLNLPIIWLAPRFYASLY